MSEGLSSRVGRIISGGLNAILDAVEDAAPDAIMEQSIREIDDAIDEVRNELGRVLAAKHLSSKTLSDKNSEHEDLSNKIEIALAQIPVLEQSIADAAEKERELEGYVAALQARKREMKEELARFREVRDAARIDTSENGAEASLGHGVSKAARAFERVMERQTGVTSGAMTAPKTAAQLQELEALARQNRVSERLAAIKTRMNK